MKLIKKLLLLAMTGVMIFSLAACSSNSGKEYEITMDEYNTTLEEYKAKYKEQAGEENWDNLLKTNTEFMASLEELVLEQIILEKVLMDNASSANIEVTDEEVNAEVDNVKNGYTNTDDYNKYLADHNFTEETFREDIKTQLILMKYLRTRAEEIMAIEPSDKELKDLYNKFENEFKKVQASHILVNTEGEAQYIKEKLDEGEDFAALAKSYSTCASAADGGDLGYFAANEMVAEFSNAAFALPVGEISEPVKSDFGYHIIKVTDIRDTFDETDKEDIIYQYRALKYDEMINGFTEDANLKMPKELEKIRERGKNNM